MIETKTNKQSKNLLIPHSNWWKSTTNATTTFAMGLAVVVASSVAGWSTVAQADSFPNETIKIISHTKAGSSTDIFARQLARAAEPILGQTIVIESRPGGSGAQQMAVLKSAKPDGYTIGVNTLTHLTSMQTNLKGVYSVDDFSWISRVQLDPYIVAVAADSQYETLADLMDANKSESDKPISVGGYGPVGSAHNIAFNILASSKDTPFNWAAYGGGSQAMTALLGNHISAVNTNPGPALQFVKAGRVRVLGVMNDERLEAFPDVPTYKEAGYDVDSDWKQVRGIYGPKGIPLDRQEKLADAFFEAIQTPEFKKYMEDSSLVYGELGPEEYSQYIVKQSDIAFNWLKKVGLVE
jgi:putative tricarboxylic transport membrane protein